MKTAEAFSGPAQEPQIPGGPTTDPTLIIGAVAPRPLPADIEAYLQDPMSVADKDERQELHFKAVRAAEWDGENNKVIVYKDGVPYWGAEYPTLFSFDAIMRGKNEEWADPNDPNADGQQLAVQQLGGKGGETTHVYVETGDGHMYCIRRTRDTLDEPAAAKQKFEIVSTRQHLGQGGEEGRADEILVRPISSEELKGIFVRPGEPLVLGVDPTTGKQLRTKGVVTRITGMNRTEHWKGKVDPRHPRLERPEFRRDTPSRFEDALKLARTMSVASKVGPLAVIDHLPAGGGAETVELSSTPTVEPRATAEGSANNPYERLTDENLEKVRNNIQDSLYEGTRQFDLDEIKRAAKNLLAVQREFERRFPAMRPEHPRGQGSDGLVYTTELSQPILAGMAAHLLDTIDGAEARFAALTTICEKEWIEADDPTAKLECLELTVFCRQVIRAMTEEYNTRNPEPAGYGNSKMARTIPTRNPHANRSNEELDGLIATFKDTISKLRARGKDAAANDLAAKLGRVGEEKKAREKKLSEEPQL